MSVLDETAEAEEQEAYGLNPIDHWVAGAITKALPSARLEGEVLLRTGIEGLALFAVCARKGGLALDGAQNLLANVWGADVEESRIILPPGAGG